MVTKRIGSLGLIAAAAVAVFLLSRQGDIIPEFLTTRSERQEDAVRGGARAPVESPITTAPVTIIILVITDKPSSG